MERVGRDVGDELLSGEGEESFPEVRNIESEDLKSVKVLDEV